MRKIRDVLRLSAVGISKRKIVASLGVRAPKRALLCLFNWMITVNGFQARAKASYAKRHSLYVDSLKRIAAPLRPLSPKEPAGNPVYVDSLKRIRATNLFCDTPQPKANGGERNQ
jgi:hypothetical protein